MKIGIDARMVGNVIDGVGRVIQSLVTQVKHFPAHNFVIFHAGAYANASALDNVEYVAVDIKPVSVRNFFKMGAIYNSYALDVLYYPFFDLPFSINCPVALVCHDLFFLQDPAYFARRKRWRYPIIRYLARQRMERAETIIAVSDTAARQIFTLLPNLPSSKVKVVRNCLFEIAGTRQLLRNELPPPAGHSPYILYVGNNREHKNLKTLLAAFVKVAQQRPDIHLIMAGRIEGQYADPRELINAYALTGRCTHLGPVSDELLNGLYIYSEFVVIPSLYEGFGIPVIEAGARRKAAICSDIDAFREVMGDEAVLFTAPQDVDAWVATIGIMLDDEAMRQRLGERAYIRSRMFSIEEFGAQNVAVLELTAAKNRVMAQMEYEGQKPGRSGVS